MKIGNKIIDLEQSNFIVVIAKKDEEIRKEVMKFVGEKETVLLDFNIMNIDDMKKSLITGVHKDIPIKEDAIIIFENLLIKTNAHSEGITEVDAMKVFDLTKHYKVMVIADKMVDAYKQSVDEVVNFEIEEVIAEEVATTEIEVKNHN